MSLRRTPPLLADLCPTRFASQPESDLNALACRKSSVREGLRQLIAFRETRTMQYLSHNTTSRARAALLSVFALIMAATLALGMAPLQAFALETQDCSARPNDDAAGSNDVLGATETRIQWDAEVAAGENITSVTLTLPDGTTFSTDDARATLLTGADRMTRNYPDTEFAVEGQNFTANFSEPIAEEGKLRLEIYGVFFPAAGGDMQITGSYTTSDGATHEIDNIPSITVAGVDVFEELGNNLAEQEWVQAWNSNTFLRLFLNPVLLVTSLPVVFGGFLMAIAIVACAFPLAIPLGFVLSLMRMSKFRVLRGIGTTYVNIVRGTPLFLQIYIAFFGLPLAGVQIPSFPLGVIVLFMNSGAYLCEIFRAGIQSIPKGQFEASRSLGMNGAQTMLFVIIPQTIRRVIPTMTSEFILLYKDTSMLAAVGIMEVVMYAKTIVAATGSITPYIVAALFYLVITLPLAKVVGKLEARLAGNDTGASSGKKKRKKAKRGVVRDMSGRPEAETRDAVDAARGAKTNTGITPEQMSSL